MSSRVIIFLFSYLAKILKNVFMVIATKFYLAILESFHFLNFCVVIKETIVCALTFVVVRIYIGAVVNIVITVVCLRKRINLE